MIIYDLEKKGTAKCVPHSVGLYKINETSSKYYRDITNRKNKKCKADCGVFEANNCITEMLDQNLQFKAEARNVYNKLAEYNLHFFAYPGSGFDTYLLKIIFFNGQLLLI